MFGLFMRGGTGMWLFLIITIMVVYLIIRNGKELYGGEVTNAVKLENGINAILFWGVISFILGYFWHFVGLYLAFGAISRASDVSPHIIAGGYQVSLITIMAGQVLSLCCLAIWFVLRSKFKSLMKSPALQ